MYKNQLELETKVVLLAVETLCITSAYLSEDKKLSDKLLGREVMFKG